MKTEKPKVKTLEESFSKEDLKIVEAMANLSIMLEKQKIINREK